MIAQNGRLDIVTPYMHGVDQYSTPSTKPYILVEGGKIQYGALYDISVKHDMGNCAPAEIEKVKEELMENLTELNDLQKQLDKKEKKLDSNELVKHSNSLIERIKRAFRRIKGIKKDEIVKAEENPSVEEKSSISEELTSMVNEDGEISIQEQEMDQKGQAEPDKSIEEIYDEIIGS